MLQSLKTLIQTSWEMSSVKHMFNMTTILGKRTCVCNMLTYVQKSPANLDSHFCQAHEVTWFLWDQFLSHKIPQEKSHRLRCGQKSSHLEYWCEIRRWPKTVCRKYNTLAVCGVSCTDISRNCYRPSQNVNNLQLKTWL